MRIWRRAAALLLALCMTVLLAACGEDPNDEKKLSVVMTGAVHTMDPAKVSTAAERTVVRHMNCGSGRERVRMLASHCAFDLLRRELEHLPIEGE